MSNSKVRAQLQAQETRGRIYAQYKKKSDFILNYQVCKAYFKDSGMSVLGVVEKILREKYNLQWQTAIIRKVLADAKGKTNALISIPQFKYEHNVYDIIEKYVERNFDKMVADMRANGSYPLTFMEIVNNL
jgi:uncharacterized membrane protein YqgA involved in biofilm formation